MCIRFSLLDYLNKLSMLCDQLSEVCHFLEEFWEEEGVVRMVVLQVKFQYMHNALLHFFNVSYIYKTRPICSQNKQKNTCHNFVMIPQSLVSGRTESSRGQKLFPLKFLSCEREI